MDWARKVNPVNPTVIRELAIQSPFLVRGLRQSAF